MAKVHYCKHWQQDTRRWLLAILLACLLNLLLIIGVGSQAWLVLMCAFILHITQMVPAELALVITCVFAILLNASCHGPL